MKNTLAVLMVSMLSLVSLKVSADATPILSPTGDQIVDILGSDGIKAPRSVDFRKIEVTDVNCTYTKGDSTSFVCTMLDASGNSHTIRNLEAKFLMQDLKPQGIQPMPLMTAQGALYTMHFALLSCTAGITTQFKYVCRTFEN
jgi:hypothetical protein